MSAVGTITVASACLVSASAVGGYLWAWARARANVRYLYGRCPSCKQRLRFLAAKAGRPGECPRCRHRHKLAPFAEHAVSA